MADDAVVRLECVTGFQSEDIAAFSLVFPGWDCDESPGIDAVEWARKMADFGAGEILLTSMDRDGTRIGFDNELTHAVAAAVPIPVIASGGVGELQHLVDGVKLGGADAVLAASIFHFAEHSIGEAKRFMADQGIEVRL